MFVMEKAWTKALSDELKKPYLKQLQEFLVDEISTNKIIYPSEEKIFEAFSFASFKETNVVIVGQDPYHNPNQAHGLSFSVKKGVKIPPSLQNIYKELNDDLGCSIPNHGYLENWAKQGILLLNSTLTVRKNKPKSHYGKGWEVFTDAVVEKLCQRTDPVVFLLWGKSAQEKCENIFFKYSTNNHLILKAAHPSPYSARNGFFGCKHFSKTNDFLKANNKRVIDWQII